jgi:ATP-dependent DNA helicase RecG
MTDLLVLTNRLRNVISLGESHFREFKSALQGPPDKKAPRSATSICADVGEALVAFANADGGDLLIGVEDDGQVTGVINSDEEIKAILAAPSSHTHKSSPLPISIAARVEIDGKTVLFFSVQKGADQIFQLPDGRCMVRRDKESFPAHVPTLIFERAEQVSRAYDRDFVDGAEVSDLDPRMLLTLAASFIRGLSPELYLQQMGLAEFGPGGLRLRKAALLLFAKDISRWHSRSQVRVLKVRGTEIKSGNEYNVHFDEAVTGNIFELLQSAWEMLRPHLAYRTRFGEGSKFEQEYLYPEEACREALVNALAHRDYSVQNGVEVVFYDDRLEIKSPGQLLSTVLVSDIEAQKGVHESRNALVARVLRESTFMRELGEGFQRIFKALAEHELSRPSIVSSHGRFSVVISNRSVFSAKQEAWISLFDGYRLSTLQKNIVVLGINGREISPQDIYAALNVKDRDIYDREVTGLRQDGILIEVRSNLEAASLARVKGADKRSIPRFAVQIPSDETAAAETPPGGFPQGRSLFIGNVAIELDQTAVSELVKGSVRFVQRKVVIEGQALQYVLAEYESQEVAQGAIAKLNGREVAGLILKVDIYRPKRGSRKRGGKGRNSKKRSESISS